MCISWDAGEPSTTDGKPPRIGIDSHFHFPAAKQFCKPLASKRALPEPYTTPPNLIYAIEPQGILGGSWDLVSKVVSTLIGVISSYKYSYPNYNPSY